MEETAQLATDPCNTQALLGSCLSPNWVTGTTSTSRVTAARFVPTLPLASLASAQPLGLYDTSYGFQDDAVLS